MFESEFQIGNSGSKVVKLAGCATIKEQLDTAFRGSGNHLPGGRVKVLRRGAKRWYGLTTAPDL